MSRERGAELGDFTANRRLLVLIPMALLVGGMAALVAAALVRLIDIVTSLAYYQRSPRCPRPRPTTSSAGRRSWCR